MIQKFCCDILSYHLEGEFPDKVLFWDTLVHIHTYIHMTLGGDMGKKCCRSSRSFFSPDDVGYDDEDDRRACVSDYDKWWVGEAGSQSNIGCYDNTTVDNYSLCL